MVYQHSTVVEAYNVLEIQQGSSLDVVKNTYKQLALKTHPDKNPGNEEATAQFQRLSEAYNVLVKHLDQSAPSRRQAYPFDGGEDHYNSDYYEEYDTEYEENLDFYMFLFAEMMRGRASRFANMRYYHHRQQRLPPETPEQYESRLRRMREEQEEAEARHAREEALRRANVELVREQEKREAEERRKAKTKFKRAQAMASQKSAAEKAREQLKRIQYMRSEVFSAARRGDIARVKKGVYEENVDAAGGEVLKGAEELIPQMPTDPQETLLHIAAKRGDTRLVEWLDAHNADPDERNAEGLTAFHLALRGGRIAIVNYYFGTYSPKDPDYHEVYACPEHISLLRLAMESRMPEAIWSILDRSLAAAEDMQSEWTYANSDNGKSTIIGSSGQAGEKMYQEILDLLSSYGEFNLEPRETSIAGDQTITFTTNDKENAPATSSSSNAATSKSAQRPSIDRTSTVSQHAVGANTSPSPQPRGQRARRPYKYQSSRQQEKTSEQTNRLPHTDGAHPEHHPTSFRNQQGDRGRRRGRAMGRGGGRGQGYPVHIPPT